ncbi:MAG: hypothetical protein NVSMB9_10510 [Isosphaeraceae bacterium]
MLVLTRKLMEKLFIGEDICVTVVRLEGGQVRLGIEAPREVSVVRAELVPDRGSAPRRPGSRVSSEGYGPNGPVPGPGPSTTPPAPNLGRTEPAIRIPQALTHGTDIRRRGRSR